MLYNTFYTADILTDILDIVGSGLNWVSSQATWLQLAIYVVAAILVLVGFFTVVKKLFKAVLVIAVLAGIVYVLDLQGIISIQGILDQVLGLFQALIFKGV